LSELRSLLAEYLGIAIHNPHGSLEALAVMTSTECPFASALAVRVATAGSEIDYAGLVDDWIADDAPTSHLR
jgi:hypothetical protein